VSYTTYTTQALVCGSFDQGTSDKSFLLFTREAGMLFATARSVREEVSKQRHALQDFSRIRVSLVKGKTGWRVGSVESLKNDFSLAQNREVRGSVVAFYRLLRRYIRGEEVSSELFDFAVLALDKMTTQIPDRKFLDLYVQIKVLEMLGYVDEKSLPTILKETNIFEVVETVDEKTMAVLEVIAAKAAENSHL
jgi:recombinational DNA repair protein (RecF pathway)